MDEGVAIVNAFAPEHLSLIVKDEDEVLSQIRTRVRFISVRILRLRLEISSRDLATLCQRVERVVPFRDFALTSSNVAPAS